ncbi:hypothetical protein GWI33_001297, partial [Rhynchophorus ferrugineus]
FVKYIDIKHFDASIYNSEYRECIKIDIFSTKVDITKMESISRHQASVEGQDSVEQRYLEMLALTV